MYMTHDAMQQAFGFVILQQSIIEPVAYRVRYPDVQYPKLIPVDTTGNEWAKSVTYFSMDQYGKAQWFHHAARDIPLADVERQKFETTVEMAAIGYRWDTEEVAQAAMVPGTNLLPDKAIAARRAYEEFVDDVALRGDALKGYSGIINYPGVTRIDVPADGAGSSPAFANKTPAQIIRDLNASLTGMWLASLTIEMADTMLMPLGLLTYLASTPMSDLDSQTILQWFIKYNLYTMQTGQQLTIYGVRGLETAGSGGLGRIVVYRRDPSVLKMHIPMPHRFLPTWQTAPLTYDVPGIFRLGGLEIRRFGAIRYVDGVTLAP